MLLLAIVVTVVVALVDWWAVATGQTRIEEVAKPLVMVGLIAVALTIESPPPGVRLWIIVALVFGLVGDVFLLPRVDQFVAGLIAFLIGHLAYVIALTRLEQDWALVLLGIVVAIAVLGAVGYRVVQGVKGTPLVGPVLAYNLVIAAMVVAAFGSGQPVAIAGALAFAASDAIIGLDRFVWDGPNHRVPIMVLYHLGQAGLVASLVAA